MSDPNVLRILEGGSGSLS